MINSVDTYIYEELKSKLLVILRNTNILEESLKAIDSDARDQFIAAYGGPDPKKEVKVSYQYPNQKEGFDARIVVQLGEAKEEGGSLGSVNSTYEFREGATITENLVIQEYEENLVIETGKLIGKDVSVKEISFSKDDNLSIEGNKLLFSAKGNMNLIGMPVEVSYVEKVDSGDEDPVGVQKGFYARESIEIMPLSNNMDTARCLDMLVKVIFITMLESIEEKTEIQLQDKTFGAMQNILPKEDSLEALVYGRPLTVSYLILHTVDFDIANQIKDILVKGVR